LSNMPESFSERLSNMGPLLKRSNDNRARGRKALPDGDRQPQGLVS
jgi:hypothetical protein